MFECLQVKYISNNEFLIKNRRKTYILIEKICINLLFVIKNTCFLNYYSLFLQSN